MTNDINDVEDKDNQTQDVYNNLNDFKKVKNGDNISVHYKGTLENGEKFDSSYDRNQVLTFDVGAGQMIKGFDSAVIGMKVGDKKTFTLEPSQAYGEKDESRIVTLDKNQFGESFAQIQVGMQISSEQGLTGIVLKKNYENALVDFNHFLAGKKLVFEIELVSIN